MHRSATTSFFLACLGFLAASPALAQDQAPRLFVSIDRQPPPQEPGPWLQSWHIAIDQQAIQQPAQAITLNLPDQREVIVRLDRWSPKAGYVSELIGDGPEVRWFPDPNAEPDEFAWEWYGRSEGHTISLIFHHGVVAARLWTRSTSTDWNRAQVELPNWPRSIRIGGKCIRSARISPSK
ncbi:MAG TPA: hypothetical protein VMR06_05470 [Dokdonella sp.]|uniref:hypothetical protein n=1 Tax=Dokdonella sp. TaxID=2291710 RepID=UPI002C1525FA|nr:hypothetical protein [Dokdonella sp.]HUD41432.1 hypothetical protein [Dokdonella sp.]